MNNEILKILYSKYDLIYDQKDPNAKTNDLFVHKHYSIITRSGIEKIQGKAGIYAKITLLPQSVLTLGAEHLVFEGNFWKTNPEAGDIYTAELPLITFSSTSPKTTTQGYMAEIGEKRCLSRGVLKMEGLYQLGIFGEDESDDFKKVMNGRSSSDSQQVR